MKDLSSYEQMQPNAQFYTSFLSTLLWSETDDNDNPLEYNYSFSDIDQCSADMIRKLCDEFIGLAGNDRILEHNYDQAGHDFYLTIAGHGAGFWDGDWPINGDYLEEISDRVSHIDSYVGDDGKIYIDVSIVGTSPVLS